METENRQKEQKEKMVLPSVKKVVHLFDDLKEAEDRRKKNGEVMIA